MTVFFRLDGWKHHRGGDDVISHWTWMSKTLWGSNCWVASHSVELLTRCLLVSFYPECPCCIDWIMCFSRQRMCTHCQPACLAQWILGKTSSATPNREIQVGEWESWVTFWKVPSQTLHLSYLNVSFSLLCSPESFIFIYIYNIFTDCETVKSYLTTQSELWAEGWNQRGNSDHV